MKAGLPKKACAGCMLAAVALSALGATGCQRTLFSNNDPYNESKIRRYYDDDSAKEARAARQRASDMGFGFATGAQNQ